VLGKPIALQSGPAWEKRLGNFHLELLDGNNRSMAHSDGHALLGHPLQAVLWLRDALRARGQALHKGQLLSLGALTPLVAVTAGMTLRARYTDLAPQGSVEVSVHFQ
jgi:2-keto-4-pentenoate hydratase